MLVLSRRPSEKIIFPSINTSVEVVAIRSGVVRLGVEAPPEVKVFRHELGVPAAKGDSPDTPCHGASESSFRQLNHAVRNRLNATSIGLALLRQQLQAGLSARAELTIDRIDEEIRAMQKQFEGLGKPTRRRRALLVEDDRNEAELFAGFLRLAGLEVAAVTDGASALGHLKGDSKPDVILMDLMLPDCEGPSVVRKIRANPDARGVRIFAVTGHPREEFELEMGANGVDRWFQKPLHPESFLHELRRELEIAA